MGYMSNAMIEGWEAGVVLVDINEAMQWRIAGHKFRLRFVMVTGYAGRVPAPGVGLADADRLAAVVEDEATRENLLQAADDMREFLGVAGPRCNGCGHATPIALVTRHGEQFCADCE
jgi:hypothetical protein